MPAIPAHRDWFHDTGLLIQTSDGKEVEIIEFVHESNDQILGEWALHLRRHYVSDIELEKNSASVGKTESEYLREFKFPTNTRPGPSVRAGDFCEILVADYVEFLLEYFVPRTRYDRKPTQNESTKGTDILAFKQKGSRRSENDELLSIEVKGTLSARPSVNPFQRAIDDSKKDFSTRLPYALNATKQRLVDRGDATEALRVERFMNKTALPYKYISGAILVCSESVWNEEYVSRAIGAHPNTNILLVVFKGEELMELANRLYEIACAST